MYPVGIGGPRPRRDQGDTVLASRAFFVVRREGTVKNWRRYAPHAVDS